MHKQTNSLEAITYFYFYFAGCINTRKSTFDYFFMLSSGAIFWSSKN